MSHKFKEVAYFLELTVRLNAKCSFFWKQILIISAHVGSRLTPFTPSYKTMQTLRILITLSHLRDLHDALRETFLKVTRQYLKVNYSTAPKPALGAH